MKRKNYPQRAYLRFIRNPIVKIFLKNLSKSYNTEDVLIIAGSPRSGTTWISDVFSIPRGISKINEPLNFKKTEIKDLGITWRTHITPDDRRPELKTYFQKLFSGRTANGYYTQQTPLLQIPFTKIWLIKFIRVSRMLPWLFNNFTFNCKPIFIIRHPCGVIYSQIKHPSFETHSFVQPDDVLLVKQYFPKFMPLLKRISTEVEIRALSWALDNIVPLQALKTDQVILISYEQLVLDYQNNVNKIYSEWAEELPQDVLSRNRKKSREAREWSEFDDSGVKKLGVWRDYLSHQEIASILEIVHEFGLTEFTENIEPDYNILYSKHHLPYPEISHSQIRHSTAENL